MLGKALKDRNMLPLPVAGKKNENSSKGSCMNTFTDVANENLEMAQSKHPSPLSSTPLNDTDSGNNGVETTSFEVEYIESENLTDLISVETSLNTLLARLDSKNWVLLCEALNNVRQISVYHKEKLFGMLGNVTTLIVKSLKNPRSAVCKTAIMTTADIFKVYSDDIIDSIDPLLVHLLLKSSQDKRFVCEAAERALIAMTTWVSPLLLLPKLQPYLKHKNPRIRAKASMCFCRSVPRLGPEGIKIYGIDKLVLIAASQLTDQLPESREAARILALELQKVYEDFQERLVEEETVPSVTSGSWEDFCQSKLSPLSAQAIIRVTTSIAKDGLVVGC